ncbi:hypothetical protein [Bradyrhizobium sp. CIR3A]|uniref:hypothetical protein n=1 Tax=Bradyrhizobium sp. CIR3A TaxID=2663838 RepID=UPI001606E895|nr:hypothetical protein [Bradyrhizobium sp. CIR3A]MBB4264367.1 hypothetical protein [Bradyrhizobium sp. CIR3A]
MQKVSAAIEDNMGEPVVVMPVTPGRPNFPGDPQPDRAVRAIAVFMAKPETVVTGDNKVHARGHSLSPLVTTSVPIFSFDHKALPWPLLQGYRITLIRSGETFEVTDIKSDSVARIEVKVVSGPHGPLFVFELPRSHVSFQ